jgi:hypothetical protein
VEGVLVADNLDIFAVAPGQNVPYIITVSTLVTDGTVTIDFTRNKDNPQINGIEVFDDGAPVPAPTFAPQAVAPVPTAAPATTFQDILINCGGTCTIIEHRVWIVLCRISITYRIALTLLYKVRYIWSNLAYGPGMRTIISVAVVRTVSPTYQWRTL